MLFLATFKVTNASRGEGMEGEAPKSKACNFPGLPQRHFSAVAAVPGCHLPSMKLAWGQGASTENPARMETSCPPHGTDHHRPPWDSQSPGTPCSGRGHRAQGWPCTRAAFYLSKLSPATANVESRGGLGRALRLKLPASLPGEDVKELKPNANFIGPAQI